MQRRIATIALIGMLLASLGLNMWLYQRGDQYYRELNETRLDPIGLAAFDQAVLPDHSQAALVVFYGDSRAAMWVAPVSAGSQFINRGIGAQTSAQVLARFDAQIAPLQPDIVVIQVGINDLKTIALFPERRDAIIAACKRNIAMVVQRSRALGSRVILTTIFPNGAVPPERMLAWSSAIEDAVREVNAYLHTLVGTQVALLESAAVLSDARGLLRSEYQRDFLHPNDQAYAALNIELLRLISNQ